MESDKEDTGVMFDAAVGRFVKAVGRESLHPVPSLDQAAQCKPLQVVVKRSKYWAWQNPHYETTPYSLHQLLQDDDDTLDKNVDVTTRVLTTYDKSHTFSVSGKIGTKLKKLIDIELKGSDELTVTAKFGEITKHEVDQPKLVEELATKKLDLNHDFVSQVQEDARKVLCVVVGSAELDKDGSVSTHTAIKGEESAEVTPLSAAEEDASVADGNSRSIGVPAGTPVAFNLRELLIHGDGSIRVIMESGLKGGFLNDQPDGCMDDDESVVKEALIEDSYSDLLEQPKEIRSQLEKAVLELCHNPADIATLLHIMKSADTGTEDGTEDDGKRIEVLDDVYNAEPIIQILDIAQFTVEDNNRLVYPELNPLILECIHSMIAALAELDDDEIEALSHCNKEQAGALMNVIYRLYSRKPAKVDKSLSSESGLSGNFLTALGITEDDGAYSATDVDPSEIEAAYRVLYALWGCEKQSKKASCVLL